MMCPSVPAMQHIAQRGIYGLRLQNLAKELGYTTAALYRYYPSKEALIESLQKKTLASSAEVSSAEVSLAEVFLAEFFFQESCGSKMFRRNNHAARWQF